MSFRDTIVNPFERAASIHVQVSSPAEVESPVSLPSGYQIPRGIGRELKNPFFTRCTYTMRCWDSSSSVFFKANGVCGRHSASGPITAASRCAPSMRAAPVGTFKSVLVARATRSVGVSA